MAYTHTCHPQIHANSPSKWCMRWSERDDEMECNRVSCRSDKFILFFFFLTIKYMLELCVLHTTITLSHTCAILIAVTHRHPIHRTMCTWKSQIRAPRILSFLKSEIVLFVFHVCLVRAGVHIFRKLGETDTFIFNALTQSPLYWGFLVFSYVFFFSQHNFGVASSRDTSQTLDKLVSLSLSLSIHSGAGV